MLQAVLLVKRFVVLAVVCPHAMQNLDPPLSEAAESGVMIGSLRPFVPVVLLRPASCGKSGLEAEENENLTHGVVASPATLHMPGFAGLDGNWCCVGWSKKLGMQISGAQPI